MAITISSADKTPVVRLKAKIVSDSFGQNALY